MIARADLRVGSGLLGPPSSDATKLSSDPARPDDPDAAPRRRFAGLSSRSVDASALRRRRSGDLDDFFFLAIQTSSAAVSARLARGSHCDDQLGKGETATRRDVVVALTC